MPPRHFNRLSPLVGYGLFNHKYSSLPRSTIALGPVRNEKAKRDDFSPAYPFPPAAPGGGRGAPRTRGPGQCVESYPSADPIKGPGTTLVLSSTPTSLQHSTIFAAGEIFSRTAKWRLTPAHAASARDRRARAQPLESFSEPANLAGWLRHYRRGELRCHLSRWCGPPQVNPLRSVSDRAEPSTARCCCR